jgi:hypothetical protein
MSHVITLQVPADAPFQALAAEAAGRVLACVGGPPEAIEHLREAVADAARAVAAHGSDLQLRFESNSDGIDVHVSCGGASRLVRQPAPRQTP